MTTAFVLSGGASLTLAINQRLAADIERYENTVMLRVVPSLCSVRISPTDFAQGAALAAESHRETLHWLEQPPRTGQEVLPAPHRH